ncbi:MAG TPA: N-acetylmuramoyl-L-alanine amidase [Candidatus Paceibacterota bacterium]|nr:N-acetylmuramoyl-L-alanine amidase [Verrucomicrobiota bacterium]HSA11778.1 N-acetylmuramoyl-L-alanine amidase [Candidatus Paceibacterota bacterium]
MTKSNHQVRAIRANDPRRASLIAAVAVAVLMSPLPPARTLAAPDNAGETREALSLRILDPRGDAASTVREVAHILGWTAPDAKVVVGGEAARVFATGIFVRDNVPLQMGENRITVVATAPNGQKAEQVLTVTRTAGPPAPPEPSERSLEIDAESIEPAQNVILSRGDILQLSFHGTPGQKAEYSLSPGNWQPMSEAREDSSTRLTGLYRASLVATPNSDTTSVPVVFRLQSKGSETSATSKAKVGFWGESQLRLVRVVEDGAAVSFGLHEVRLGGPYLADLPAGTLLRVCGMRGNYYHIRLTPDMDGWISSRDVEPAPAGAPPPHLSFTDLSVYGNESEDRVGIPYPAPVPFAVKPAVSPAGRAALEVDFYGAHHAATWISHRPTARVIREVTLQQVATDHLRLCVELQTKQLWGYQWAVTNRSLLLTVRRPPALAPAPGSPLKGLTLALEAGHGGSGSGARGVSGSQEKDINRLAVEELARQFEAAGARTLLVRPGDENPSLSERVRRAVTANADLFISVHANSAGHQRGYLSVSGTSTYYKWPFCRDLSEAIHARLLEITKLNDFGNVGNFNYYPLRANTWMPSMLVEQAFMSNPEDEAKMLDPGFRKEMMRAVIAGTEDWLNRQRTEAKE